MTSKKTKTKETKKLGLLKKKVNSLKVDMEAIVTEHDFYTFDTEADASKWFNCLPIETLEESLAVDRKLPRAKPSLQDLNLKSKLRKGYYEKKDILEVALIEMNIAAIDCTLAEIKRINV